MRRGACALALVSCGPQVDPPAQSGGSDDGGEEAGAEAGAGPSADADAGGDAPGDPSAGEADTGGPGADDDPGEDGVEPEPLDGCTPAWERELVEGPLTGTPDLDRGIAVGPDGTVHLFYGTQNTAHHARRVDGEWELSEFDAEPLRGTAGFVDATGTANLLWSSDGVLRHARLIAGEWDVQASDFGDCSVVAAVEGADGVVHTAGHSTGTDATPLGVCYGRRDAGGDWTSQWLAEASDRGAGLVVDSDGTVHISFRGAGVLQHATESAGRWSTQTVGDVTGGRDSQLTRGPDGRLYIAHTEPWFGSVEIAAGVAGEWANEVILPEYEYLDSNSPGMAFGAAGAQHLVHSQVGDEECLVYRVRADLDAPWQVEALADEHVRGGEVTLGADGTPHVMYIAWDHRVYYSSPLL